MARHPLANVAPAATADREALLADTLRNAVRAPYYRRAFGDRWRTVTLETLHRLPLLDKPTAIHHQRKLVVGRAPPGPGVVSSGTLRAGGLPPLNVLHSDEEFEAMAVEPVPEEDVGGGDASGWTLVVVGAHHGFPAGQPPEGELFVPWVLHRNALHLIETALARPQPDGRRVTAMRISAGALKLLTVWLLEQGKDPRRHGLELIGTNGSRLSPFWRALVGEAFGAELFDNYSLSEFYTPATECRACGWRHFGWPPILFEVLDLASRKPKRDGVGELVLTGLSPYAQKMPLVRYRTGDAVALGPTCRPTGERGVRFLGRVSRGIVVKDGGGGAFVLAPTSVQDALEALPEAERNPQAGASLGFVQSRDLGLPRWVVERAVGRPPTVRLRFEVRFDPAVFRRHATWVEQHVRQQVLANDEVLAGLVRRGRAALDVRAEAPRSLKPPPDKFE